MRMGDIWVMNADGTGQAQLTATSELDTSPSFTPDGRILFSRIVTTPAFNQEIFVMGSDGSGQTNLTNDPAGDSSPDMAPDGTTITFTRLVSSSPLDFDIFVMNSDGSGQAGVVTGPALDTASVFAPDGNRIAFSRNPTGPAIAGEIFAAAGNGADPVNLTNTGDEDIDSQPDWQPDLTPPPETPPPDTVPPDTTLKRRPRNIVHGTRARYRFSSNETGSTFECKLDHRKFKPCNSPKKYKHLQDGKHTFRVRAIDAAGNVDPKPAKDSFKVR
jgi:hypothetical protein